MGKNLNVSVNSESLSLKENKNFVKFITSKNHTFIVNKWNFKHRVFYRAMMPILKGIIPTFFNFEIFGIENLLQFSPNLPLILVSNHRSHLDNLVGFTTVFPPRGNRMYLTTITNGNALTQNFVFKMMRFLGAYPIDTKKTEQSVEYLYQTLQNGLAVGIFPQGGRIVRTPIEDYQNLSNEGKSGVGRLVLRTSGQIPILPVYMHGTAEALTRGSFKPKFRSYISVRIGKPITFPEYNGHSWDLSGKDFYDTSRTVTDQIMKKVQELCFETEKLFFSFIEQKYNTNITDLKLSEQQSKKLRKWLRKYSHYPPSAFGPKNSS